MKQQTEEEQMDQVFEILKTITNTITTVNIRLQKIQISLENLSSRVNRFKSAEASMQEERIPNPQHFHDNGCVRFINQLSESTARAKVAVIDFKAMIDYQIDEMLSGIIQGTSMTTQSSEEVKKLD